MKKILMTLATAIVPFVSSFAALTLVSPKDGATVATLNAAHKDYYSKSQAERRVIDAAGLKSVYRWNLITNATCFPQKTTFSWTGSAPFRLKICRAADQSVFFETNGLTATSFVVGNFEIGTAYKWAVSNASSTSAWRTFTTESDGPRLLDGASEYIQDYGSYGFSTPTPHGVRDLGGYTGLDGRRSRQGLLIRSSQLDAEYGDGAASHITDKNRKFWKEFIPIKTEIDLRSSSASNPETKITKSPLGNDVTYKRYSTIPGYAKYFGSDKTSLHRDLRYIIEWCADASHYPIVFHCVHGKDRTGALAMIFGGLLGYDADTILKDYEATMFWNPGQGSDPVFDLQTFFVTNTWANTSGTPSSVNEGIYNYVRKTGVSVATIEAFREIMLEPKSEPTHTHSWSAWSIAAEPTVAAAGTKRRTCAGCNEVDTASLAKLPNRYDWIKTDGKGYVLTDYTPNLLKTCIETRFTLLPTTDGAFWTANKSTQPKGTGCGAQTLLNYGGKEFSYFNQPTDSDIIASFADGFDDQSQSHVIVTHGQTVDMDGVRVVSSISGYTANDKAASGPLMLAAGNYCNDERHEVVPTAVKLHTLRVREVEGGVTNLVRVYVPCTNASGAATFWDVWNETYCTVSGTGAAFEAGNGEPTPPEPEPEVETFDWLQTDGLGHIMTDYHPDLAKTRMEIVYEQTSQDGGFLWMANNCTQPGGKDSGVQTSAMACGLGAAAGEELSYCNQPAGVNPDIQMTYGTPQANVVKTNVTHGASAWLNGVRYDLPGGYTPPANTRTTGPLVLFAGNWASKYAFAGPWKGKVYALRISEVSGGVTNLIHNYVPATNEFGVATLYDRETKSFATVDAGTYAVGNGYPTPPGPGPGPLDPVPTVKPQATWPIADDTVDILTAEQRGFLSRPADERRALFTNVAYRTALASRDGGFCDPQPAALAWTGDGLCTVRVWKVSAGAETLHFETNLIAQTVKVDNFEVAQRYRWEVANALGASGGTFVTRDETPRLLRDPDPQQNIQGIRDLGGRKGLDGRRLKQGRIFRCSEFNYKEPAAAGQPGENFVNDLNRDWWLNTLDIRTDLDLRSDSETQYMTESPLGPNVAWQHKPGVSYSFAENPANFKAAFPLFLNAANYPIAFHCVAGQDRTGCLAFVLEALLGVDDDECLKDWEANAFRHTDASWCHANGMDEFVAGFADQPGETLKDRITAWVKAQGYTDADLATFRELMLEPGEEPKPTTETFDWLQTDGAGYFVTDYVPQTAKTRMEMRLRFTSVAANSGLAIANRGTAGKTTGVDAEWGACYFAVNAKKKTDSSIQYYTEPGGAGATFARSFVDTNAIHTIVFGAGITVLDGATNDIATAASDLTAAGPMALFAANWGETTYQAMANVKCYGIRIWEVDGGVETPVRNYVAATNAAGVATLYDTVTKKFLTPTSGAGFRVGNDVVGPTVDGETVPFTQEAMNDQTRINTSKTIEFPSAEGLSVSGTSVTYGGTTVTLRDYYLVSLDGARLVLALNPTNAVPTIGAVSETVPALSVEATEVKVGVPMANQREGLYYSLNGYGEVNAAEPTKFGTTAPALTVEQFGCEKPAPEKGFFRIGVTDVPPVQ